MTINRRFLGENPSPCKVADTNDFPKERFEDSDWVGYSTDKNRRVTEQLHGKTALDAIRKNRKLMGSGVVVMSGEAPRPK